MIDVRYEVQRNVATATLVCDEKKAQEVLSEINTYNTGTWLEPFSMDTFVNIWTGDKLNPAIQMISSGTEEIQWALQMKDADNKNIEPMTVINYVELKMIDRSQKNIMTKKGWDEIFVTDADHIVGPNGSLYVNNHNGFNIKLRNHIKKNHFIGYTLYFCVVDGDDEFYCKIDPIIKIRGGDAKPA